MLVGMTNHIVTAYDSSSSFAGEAALWAAAEASARQIPLQIISCYQVPIVGEAGGVWLTSGILDSIAEGATTAAMAMQHVIEHRHPSLEVKTDVYPGPARVALIDGLNSDDLVVVGASAHDGASAFWLGSTARWVAHHSPCPVVVVHGAAARGVPSRIVVGTDGSAFSHKAITWAADEANLHGAELVVVHSWEFPYLELDSRIAQARDIIRVDAATVLEQGTNVASERTGMTVAVACLKEVQCRRC